MGNVLYAGRDLPNLKTALERLGYEAVIVSGGVPPVVSVDRRVSDSDMMNLRESGLYPTHRDSFTY